MWMATETGISYGLDRLQVLEFVDRLASENQADGTELRVDIADHDSDPGIQLRVWSTLRRDWVFFTGSRRSMSS